MTAAPVDLIARNDDARSRREKGGQWPPFLFLVAVTGSRSSLPSWGSAGMKQKLGLSSRKRLFLI